MNTIVRPTRRDTPELLDQPQAVLADLSANLRDIRNLNRWFGGTSLALKSVLRLTSGCTSVSVLDVATGSADIPLALWHALRRSGLEPSMVALDSSAEVLAEAAAQLHGAAVELQQGDARALPYPDHAFDIVLCCLALHHFPPHEAVSVLGEMRRVARRGMIVIDLRRGYLAYAGTWLATHTVARNRLTRHDGPLSVLRAYTPEELSGLARRAGIPNPTIKRHIFFRQSLVAGGGPATHG